MMPRATMIRGDWGRFERVDAFTHEHIDWITDEEMNKIDAQNREKARRGATKNEKA